MRLVKKRASRGLGALICEKFAAEGCNVAINYNSSREKAEQVAAKIEKEYGIRSLVVPGVSLQTGRPAFNLNLINHKGCGSPRRV